VLQTSLYPFAVGTRASPLVTDELIDLAAIEKLFGDGETLYVARSFVD